MHTESILKSTHNNNGWWYFFFIYIYSRTRNSMGSTLGTWAVDVDLNVTFSRRQCVQIVATTEDATHKCRSLTTKFNAHFGRLMNFETRSTIWFVTSFQTQRSHLVFSAQRNHFIIFIIIFISCVCLNFFLLLLSAWCELKSKHL